MENKKLLVKIEHEYMRSRRLYGVRRITAALKRGNTPCGHNRVARLMQEKGLRSLRKGYRRTTTNSNHNHPIAPNLLGRGYKATRPNQVWVSDLTYVPTSEGWLYLAAIEDLCLKKVVGWSMGSRITKEWVRRPEIDILTAQIEHEDRKTLSTVSAWIEQEQ
jgi:transposase InsO family protein